MEKADALLQLQTSANNIYLPLKSNTQVIQQPSVETATCSCHSSVVSTGLIMKAQVLSQGSPRRISGGKGTVGKVTSPSTSVFPNQQSFHQCTILISLTFGG